MALPACEKQAKMQQISWQMCGVWIEEDGHENGTISFSVTGNLPVETQKQTAYALEMEINWPEDFAICNMGKRTYTVYADIGQGQHHNLWCSGTCYDERSNTPQPLQFVIFPKENAIVFDLRSVQGAYLVASTDPNADGSSLLQMFFALNL